MQSLDTLKTLTRNGKRMVFFGGAGVSTESGIPDFRSAAGLYAQKAAVSPETILSHGYFVSQPDAFFNFYRRHMLFLHARPNAAHQKLAQWEREGRLQAVITQNIDGLHQAAGSRRVIELHGSVLRNHCMACHKAFPVQAVAQASGSPRCECGGLIKPDVVLYEEALNEQDIQAAIAALRTADVLIVGGTSLSVYPAAGLIRYFQGDHMVLINRTPTPYDHLADVCIYGSIGDILKQA
ncbi:MAG: NAD-dependent protein deacylase [Clostridia bacterium]|nr:NAD-dependent protein deacylase [Clostridia bacterium]